MDNRFMHASNCTCFFMYISLIESMHDKNDERKYVIDQMIEELRITVYAF